ncbi:MAG TPA: chorismate mutase [Oligoflexia bacterium]|nr:chorismate mutase [Oligoflexia bacterium]HMP47150.1 chorismate mutase [Oligoflexia bacterium]
MTGKLDPIRKKINSIDEMIADLLCERAAMAREVRRIKSGEHIATYLPDREKAILDRVLPRLLEAGFSREKAEGVFLSVISACRSIVGDIEFCFPGLPGSINHAAALKQFGTLPSFAFVRDFREVFNRLESGLSQCAILPASRSGDGISMALIELLVKSSVRIIAEREVREEYSLYSCLSSPKDIKIIYGEGDVLDITREFLSGIAPSAKFVLLGAVISDIQSTSSYENPILADLTNLRDISRVLDLEDKSLGVALVSASGFSHELGVPTCVEVIRSGVLSVPDNLTDSPDHGRIRNYYVLGKDPLPLGSADVSLKTALVCACKDSGGVLRNVLEPFNRLGLSLSRIESKNSRNTPWECMFFMEVEGGFFDLKAEEDQVGLEASTKSAFSELMTQVLRELETICIFVKVLGSYPRFPV